MVHDQLCHTRVQRGASTDDGMNAIDDLIQAGTFKQVSGGTLGDGGENVALPV